MRKILWRSWDPLNLDRVAPDDEYDQYAAVIASKLKRGQPTSEIATYLLRTLTDPDAPPPRSWVAQCQATAGELVEWYRRSTAP